MVPCPSGEDVREECAAVAGMVYIDLNSGVNGGEGGGGVFVEEDGAQRWCCKWEIGERRWEVIK